MTVLRTELDALLDRVREDKADTTGKNRNVVAYDCRRMFEDLAESFKEESAMRDRYKRQSNGWRDKSLELDEVNRVLLEAVEDALAFLDRPDITTYEWYKLAPEHVGKFRRAIEKARTSNLPAQVPGIRKGNNESDNGNRPPKAATGNH